ncbi:MAG: DUF5114 domain-containing protein [Proteiniphilum sp.]|jgi:hypothetical protein|uniref:DUF5114 domain-containing protein n=1 Tax=Proteiniphilum sp. TaxID=1926877 RepID=UPI002B20A81B|nr:DUF5114 domain-containing protein [Proteiniphilum sp.]MEA5129388.1 DUF5114 domain-containing protein [Proteiniphilum sp.]
MNIVHILKKYPVVILLLLLTACEEDGDKIYLSGLEASEFILTETDILLSKENASKIVLSAAWKNNTLVVSNPDMGAPDVFTAYLQISTQEDFSSNVIETEGTGESKAYTGAELNAIARNLGLVPDVATPVYFRLRGSIGANMESAYSGVKTVYISPYLIDMTVGFILDKDKQQTGLTLASPDADGIYTGFVGATSWYNFFMEEGDGKIWGNLAADGSAFLASSEEGSWNFWYPEPGGCYYTEVNTVRKRWSAIYLPALEVSGDITGEMTFDRPNTRWYYVFNAASAGTATIRFSGQGDEYNYETGDGAPAAGKVTIAFAQENGQLVLTGAAGTISVQVPAAGECTLILDLSDPKNWTCEVTSGSEEPEPVAPEVYVIGIDDGITGGGWNFDNKLYLYNEDNLAYAGVLNVHSLWGYQIGTEKDNWGDVYTQAGGDAYSGTLEFKGQNNLAAPAPGVYLFDVSLKNLTYALTAVGDHVYVNGLDDKWEFNQTLAATSVPGVYSGSITVSGASSYGFKIYLVQNNWNMLFGGSDGKLTYGGADIPDSNSWSAGTYTITVDLVNRTYTIQ